MTRQRPAVGLLYNPSTPALLARAPELVEHLSAMPDRMWFDFGDEGAQAGRRFRHAYGAVAELRGLAQGRSLAGHGLGLSLPSAMPLDESMLEAVVQVAEGVGGFAWYSEHLSVFVAPGGAAVPNAQAGLGLPVVYGDESFGLLVPKLRRLSDSLGCRVLLENPAQFSALSDLDCSEPEFLNRLYRAGACGTLLDLHNLYVCQRNGVCDPRDYLAALDLDSVEEVHLAGGDEFGGFYMDSHATITPPAVWELAHEFLPRCRRLRAITLEYQESYFEQIGWRALVRELELMHELAARC